MTAFSDPMRHSLVQFSVVVAAQCHNPSILNPDFLRVQEIVPKEWEWSVIGSPICTPPFSTVQYSAGVSIIVESTKFQIVDTGMGNDALGSKATVIAKRYVTTLPHVNFVAVGLNFQSVIDSDSPDFSPDGYLKNRFLKPGGWDTDPRLLKAFGLRFVYPLASGRTVFSLDIGETRTAPDASRQVVVADCNFHRDIIGSPDAAKACAHLDQLDWSWSYYKDLLRDVVGIT